jgi:hypothetical protein
MIMMIVSATGIGLATKIRKISAAFNGHIIVSGGNNQSEIYLVLFQKQDFYLRLM